MKTMKSDLKEIIEIAKVSFTSAQLAYENGYADGFEQGRRVGFQEGKAEGVRVWAEMQAEHDKAAKLKETL